MLTLNDERVLARWESLWLDPDHMNSTDDDEEIWNKADDEAEEAWYERGNYDK